MSPTALAHESFSVPMPPTIVMSGRPKPACVWASDLLRKANPPAAPYPTAGSVIGTTIGRKPYFSFRKLLRSGQPSSTGFFGCSCAASRVPAVRTATASTRRLATDRMALLVGKQVRQPTPRRRALRRVAAWSQATSARTRIVVCRPPFPYAGSVRAPQRVLGGCLVLLALSATSCSYLADRALDFTDAFRFTLGVGTSAGVRARAGLALDTGLLIGVKPRAGTVGWRYGAFYFFDQSDSRIDCEQAEIVRTTALLGHDFTDGSYQTARTSLFLLPALFSWVDTTPTDYQWHVPQQGDEFSDRHWLWSGE